MIVGEYRVARLMQEWGMKACIMRVYRRMTEEQELLEAYESGEFESDPDEERGEYLAKAVKEFKKDKRQDLTPCVRF